MVSTICAALGSLGLFWIFWILVAALDMSQREQVLLVLWGF